jgi:hypothetical protein
VGCAADASQSANFDNLLYLPDIHIASRGIPWWYGTMHKKARFSTGA